MPVTAKNSRIEKLTIDRYVCSTRDQCAIARFTRWPRRADGGGDAPAPGSLLDDLVVVKRYDAQLGARLELDRLRLAGERHLLAVDLIRAVLARRLDRHGVLAGLHGIARLVLAVPLERVFAGRARGDRKSTRLNSSH